MRGLERFGGDRFLKLSNLVPLNNLINESAVGNVFMVLPTGMLMILCFGFVKASWV